MSWTICICCGQLLSKVQIVAVHGARQAAGLDVIIVFPLAFAIAVQGGASILQEGYFGTGTVARFDGHGHLCLF